MAAPDGRFKSGGTIGVIRHATDVKFFKEQLKWPHPTKF